MADINPLALIGKSNIAPDEPGRKAAADLQRGLGMIELQNRGRLENTQLAGDLTLDNTFAGKNINRQAVDALSQLEEGRLLANDKTRATSLNQRASGLGTLAKELGLYITPKVSTVAGLKDPTSPLFSFTPGNQLTAAMHGLGAAELKNEESVTTDYNVDARTRTPISPITPTKKTSKRSRKTKRSASPKVDKVSIARKFVAANPTLSVKNIIVHPKQGILIEASDGKTYREK